MTTAVFTSTFRNFRRILALNNAVIEKIAEMERALGGEYVFDRAFLHTTLRELHRLVREVIYNLNEMDDNRYPALYDRFESIRNNLQELLVGGPGPYGGHLALPYTLLHRDLDHLVGAKNANLGEVRNSLKLRTPDGFALTVAAYARFMEENDLFERIARLRRTTPDRAEYTVRLRKLFQEAAFPPAVREEIRRQLKALLARQGTETLLAVRSSAVGEDGRRSFAGQFESLLNVQPAEVFDACRQVIAARFSPRVLDYLEPETADRELPMAVGIQQMVPARLSGVVYTKDPTEPAEDLLTISAVPGTGEALVSGKAEAERFSLDRHHPFPLVRSRTWAKSTDWVHPDHRTPLSSSSASALRRGSALLNAEQRTVLAETGMLLEKTFDAPQDIEWALDEEGELFILQSRRLHQPPPSPPQPAAVAAELRESIVLMQGRGLVAQLGVAAGPVIHVTPESDPATFPVGGIAVCRYASPQLAGIVRKAAAVITDIGSPTGHLATIAREYRTPALFDTGQATQVLKGGFQITVDTEDRRVYAGVISGLLQLQTAREEPYQNEPELRTLRRLLRWIAPINLIDPTAPGFTIENCRTYHDLIRFCHEKAVESLIDLHSSSAAAAGTRGYELVSSVPLKIRVIDLGGGLAPNPETEKIQTAQVRSRPLRALLKGLQSDAAWSREPAPFGWKDLLSSMGRPLTTLSNAPRFTGENLALAAENYCNLSLRLGYHFNVIDSYISADPDDNYIYFRFVGGMAEQAKRERRITLIAAVLSALHFKVDRQGDLLVGKAKMLAPEHMDAILIHLGELIAFTRQLDVRMTEDSSVDLFYDHFLERIRRAIQDRKEN